MKKTFSLIVSTIVLAGMLNMGQAFAVTYNITPKTPAVSASLKPAITKYKQENYVGAMQDIEKLLKKEKNNTYAKYYLALCYTRLGYREKAEEMYKSVIETDDNMALVYYSQRALQCIGNEGEQRCQSPNANFPQEQPVNNGENAGNSNPEYNDIAKFIESGKRMHPEVIDSITKERMERELQESEYRRKQQEANQFKSDAAMPTNEEIAAALNTLSKIGMNPYQINTINQASLLNQNGFLGNNGNLYSALMLNNYANPDIAKTLLYNQLTQQQNNLFNYGI